MEYHNESMPPRMRPCWDPARPAPTRCCNKDADTRVAEYVWICGFQSARLESRSEKRCDVSDSICFCAAITWCSIRFRSPCSDVRSSESEITGRERIGSASALPRRSRTVENVTFCIASHLLISAVSSGAAMTSDDPFPCHPASAILNCSSCMCRCLSCRSLT